MKNISAKDSLDSLESHKELCTKFIFKNISDNTLLKQFCDEYIKSLTAKGIQQLSPKDLFQFLVKQFKQFKTSIKSSTESYDISYDNATGKVIASIMCADAQFIIFTIENIFKHYNLDISTMYHPLISYYLNSKKNLISIDSPQKDNKLFSICYVEAYANDKLLDIEDFKKDLKNKVTATQYVNQDLINMNKKLCVVQNQISNLSLPKPEFQSEWIELMDWLNQENFSLFGYQEFHLTKKGSTTSIKQDKSNGLGILSSNFLALYGQNLSTSLKEHIKKLSNYRSPFIIDSIPIKSPLKRFDDLMRISLKIPQKNNQWIEHNFIGLLKRSSLLAKNTDTPIIKLKIKKIMQQNNFWPSSHKYNQTIRLLNNIPKIELFKTPTENLSDMIKDLLAITNPNEIAFFTRKKIDTSRLFLLGIIPNNLAFDTNFNKIIDTLKSLIPNKGVSYFPIKNELFTRLHIYFEQPKHPNWYPKVSEIDATIKELIKPWEDRLQDSLFKKYSQQEASRLFSFYRNAFPNHYQLRRNISETTSDIKFLEHVKKYNVTAFDIIIFRFKDSLLSGKAFLLNVYFTKKIDLYQFIPIFRNLNIYFHDELTTRIGNLDNIIGYIHSFRISFLENAIYKPPFEQFKPRFLELLNVIFQQKLPNDPINGLISNSNCNWKDIYILQAYRNYFLQLQPNYTKEKINRCLLTYNISIELIVEYFRSKFTYSNSNYPSKTQLKKIKDIESNFHQSLNSVSNIDDDYILKRLFNLVQHTLRTNFFQHELEDNWVLSLKFDTQNMISNPPKSFREIYIFAPTLEGVHIRFGKVSRGGIRWSSRLSDFRNEIMGLATTQKVKNVVIVPNGSKGGFIIKKTFKREDAGIVSKEHYQQFIQGLISITDSKNVDNSIMKPKNVICYDDDDPYLVVAADKGTATFSDIANQISSDNNFWLADAFASGGSAGFNHKELGITAKGAWECVKLHFLEKDKDINKTPFTCIGIGDMSGDVFGNGMLLSKQTKLIAAFNHLHIFIDPNPDPATSWAERKRLFDLPRSSWTNYNKTLISAGGGVFQRDSKEIKLSIQIQKMLNLPEIVNGSELIHALLKANVELLWFGGIGTYIKANEEHNSTVGDLANDNVRINYTECQADIIGEGANLGITQLARIKMSQALIKLNTDFIDNSAGVNISDYEVNLKIFLTYLLHNNHIKSQSSKNNYLKKATNSVIESVLENNISQHKLISIEEIRSSHEILHYESLINSLIASGSLNQKTDIVPSAATFEALDKKKAPLSRPMLAKLQAIVKLEAYEHISQSTQFSHNLYQPLYESYFPKELLKQFRSFLDHHPLKNEIIATLVTNYIVNHGGILFFNFMQDTTGHTYNHIASVYILIDQMVQGAALRKSITSQKQPMHQNYKQLIRFENHLNSMVLDALQLKNPLLDLTQHKKIRSLYSTFIHSKLTRIVEPYLQPVDNLFIDIFAVSHTIKKSNYEHIVTKLNILHDFFEFNLILTNLYVVNLITKWEVDQYKILQTMLSKKNHAIIQHCFNSKRLNELNCYNDLNNFFSKGLSHYKRQLTQFKTLETISLSALTVVINTLDIITFD